MNFFEDVFLKILSRIIVNSEASFFNLANSSVLLGSINTAFCCNVFNLFILLVISFTIELAKVALLNSEGEASTPFNNDS